MTFAPTGDVATRGIIPGDPCARRVCSYCMHDALNCIAGIRHNPPIVKKDGKDVQEVLYSTTVWLPTRCDGCCQVVSGCLELCHSRKVLRLEPEDYAPYQFIVPAGVHLRLQRVGVANAGPQKYNGHMATVNEQMAHLSDEYRVAFMQVGIRIYADVTHRGEEFGQRVYDERWLDYLAAIGAQPFQTLVMGRVPIRSVPCKPLALGCCEPLGYDPAASDFSGSECSELVPGFAEDDEPPPFGEAVAQPPQAVPKCMKLVVDPMEEATRAAALDDKSGPTHKRVGYQIAPAICHLQTEANEVSSLRAAAEKRFGSATLPKKLENIKERVGKRVQQVAKWFTKETVADSLFDLDLRDLLSKGWTEGRKDSALNNYDFISKMFPPDIQMKHNEFSEGTKPGRVVVNAGTERQIVMATLIHALEKVMFKKMGISSIKGRSRDAAINRLITQLMLFSESDYLSLLEGDGSAWDSTMSQELREMIEKPILDKIHQCMGDMGRQDRQDLFDTEYRRRFATKSQWTAAFKGSHDLGVDKITMKVLNEFNVRESGDRGTSSLNYLVNMILWAAYLQVDLNEKKEADSPYFTSHALVEDGKLMKVAFCFEGDDSIVVVRKKDYNLQLPYADISTFFAEAGLNFKLVPVDGTGIATFVGCHLLLVEGKLTGDWVPELKRNLRSSAFVKADIDAGQETQRRTVAYFALMARALSHVHHAPAAARYYRACAQHHRGEMATEIKDPRFLYTLEMKTGCKMLGEDLEQRLVDEGIERAETETELLLCNRSIGGNYEMIQAWSYCESISPFDWIDLDCSATVHRVTEEVALEAEAAKAASEVV